jgi:hypothetical protein
MISGLESLQLPLYQDFIDNFYFAVFPIQYGVSNYIIYQSDNEGNLNFWSVNMNSTNVLTANYFTFNVIPAVIVNYRSIIVLKYKNKSFKLIFSVPFIDQLVGTKSVIQNLFNDETKAFVLYDKIVLFFSKIKNDSYYRFVYAGLLSKGLDDLSIDLKVLPTTKFDFANGTLVGLLDKKPYLLYNKFGVESLNLYPYANYIVSINQQKSINKVVVGGINNYFLQPEPSKPHLSKCSYCYELQYQASFYLSDSNWGYIPLITQILIPNTCEYIEPATGPTYIMGFDSQQPQYVYLGNTQFLNSDNTIITFKSNILYTDNFDSYDWIIYPSMEDESCNTEPQNGKLYYYYDNQEFVIYQPTFNSFLSIFTGSISINDLLFSSDRNKLLIKASRSIYGSTPNPGNEFYNHKYKNSNWYFLYFDLDSDNQLYISDQSYENTPIASASSMKDLNGGRMNSGSLSMPREAGNRYSQRGEAAGYGEAGYGEAGYGGFRAGQLGASKIQKIKFDYN